MGEIRRDCFHDCGIIPSKHNAHPTLALTISHALYNYTSKRFLILHNVCRANHTIHCRQAIGGKQLRIKSCLPSSRSNSLSCLDKGGCVMCKEIQMFGFLYTYKLLSYPNLFYQTLKLWEYKPLKGLYFLYHFIPQKSTNEPSGFFHFGETFASFSHSNVANAFRSSSVVTSR